MYTIMTDATDHEKAVMIYVGQWETVQTGTLVVVDELTYRVDHVEVTVNRRGGQTQEVVVKRSR